MTEQEALAKIESHEEICEERYKNIDEKLSTMNGNIHTIFKSITELRRAANIALGVWLGTMGIGVIVSIIWTLMQITGTK